MVLTCQQFITHSVRLRNICCHMVCMLQFCEKDGCSVRGLSAFTNTSQSAGESKSFPSGNELDKQHVSGRDCNKIKGGTLLKVWNLAASPWPISEPEQIFGLWAGKKLDVLARGTLTDVVHAPADYTQGTCWAHDVLSAWRGANCGVCAWENSLAQTEHNQACYIKKDSHVDRSALVGEFMICLSGKELLWLSNSNGSNTFRHCYNFLKILGSWLSRIDFLSLNPQLLWT